MVKFCTNCRMKLTKGASFYQFCGMKVESPTIQTRQPEPITSNTTCSTTVSPTNKTAIYSTTGLTNTPTPVTFKSIKKNLIKK